MKWHWMLSIGPAVLWGAACGYHANAFDPQLQPPAGRTIDDAVVEAGGQEDLAGLELPGMRVDVVEESQTEVTIPVAGCMDEAALNYDVEATEDDGSCLYNVTLTFKLDMTCAADETAPQVAGGNTFGMPGDHPMADPDGDHIWEVAITLPPALSTCYTYTSDACTDWSCKEDISGQECATDPYNDRSLNTGTEDHEVKACFGQCGDGFCGACR
jgi:hypothetical protein